jgi:glycosyltransferase involved in cell wall biosynthesis
MAWRRADHPTVEWWTGAADVVWGPNFVVPPTRAAAQVVSVHDLTPLRFPELCQRDTLAYPALVRRAVERGALVQTDSEAVASEVREWLGLATERVVAVPLGVDPPRAGDPAAGRRRAGSARYVLALGTVEPRKDLPTLVAAFDLAAASLDDLTLVVAGPDGWGVDAFEAAVGAACHRARIRRLGWVDHQTRADLLAGARCLAFPSLYEGFGLPPLEAMAASVPVLCSDLPVLSEVTGGAARLVPARDPEAWAEALVGLEADEAARAELARRGRERAAGYTWDACARRMGDLLRDAARGAPGGTGVARRRGRRPGTSAGDIGRGRRPIS